VIKAQLQATRGKKYQGTRAQDHAPWNSPKCVCSSGGAFLHALAPSIRRIKVDTAVSQIDKKIYFLWIYRRPRLCPNEDRTIPSSITHFVEFCQAGPAGLRKNSHRNTILRQISSRACRPAAGDKRRRSRRPRVGDEILIRPVKINRTWLPYAAAAAAAGYTIVALTTDLSFSLHVGQTTGLHRVLGIVQVGEPSPRLMGN
jgi:hypothetical protein